MNKQLIKNGLTYEDYLKIKFPLVDQKEIKRVVFDEKFKGRFNYGKRVKFIINSGVNPDILKEIATKENEEVKALYERKEQGEIISEKKRRLLNKSKRGRFDRILLDVTNDIRKIFLNLNDTEIEKIKDSIEQNSKKGMYGKPQSIGIKLIENKDLRSNQLNAVMKMGGHELDSPITSLRASTSTKEQRLKKEADDYYKNEILPKYQQKLVS